MHFVTGGAFQGKGKWIRSYYNLNERNDIIWISGYQQSQLQLPRPDSIMDQGFFVFEGLERAIRQSLQLGEDNIRDKWLDYFTAWSDWENERRTVIFIGCDITKGIVPMEQEERKWRDLVGWCYQDLGKVATTIDIIWSGIPQRIK